MEAYGSFPVSTLSCWALLICSVFVQNVWMWDVTFAGVGRCRLEIETGGIAIDLLHGLVHVQKRFREKAKKREKGQMCSLQLIGAEALVLDLISFSEAASLSPPTPCNYAEAFFNSLHLTKTFFFLNFKPVLLCRAWLQPPFQLVFSNLFWNILIEFRWDFL